MTCFTAAGRAFFAFLFVIASLMAVPAGADPASKPIAEILLSALQESFKLSQTRGDAVWPGYGVARFGFLLVEPGRETLICDDRLPEGFVRAPDEPRLGCPIAIGPASWRQPSFLSSMPVFGPPSLIVMGTPETTGRPLVEWKMTIMHEHFHQWQSAAPGYYDRVEALGLSGGDQTGMWMLNYPFPYANQTVVDAHARASLALRAAIGASKGRPLRQASRAYLGARRALQATVSEADWRYLEFQLWQEGAARWTEFTVNAQSEDRSVRLAARALRDQTLTELAAPNLKGQARVAFYALGAGEALLLDRIAPGWRRCYQQDLALGPRFERPCRAK